MVRMPLVHPCMARVPVGMHFCHLNRWEEPLPVPQWSPAELSPSLPRTILLVLAPASPTTLLHHPPRKRGRPFLNVQGPSSWTRQARDISPEGTRGAEERVDRMACCVQRTPSVATVELDCMSSVTQMYMTLKRCIGESVL